MTSSEPLKLHLFGAPELRADGELVPLSPFQMALVAVTYAGGGVDRPSVANLFWRHEADARTRARIRQLVHQTKRRAEYDIILTQGDRLLPAPGVAVDVADFCEEVATGQYAKAARRLVDGFLTGPLPGLSGDFDDWCRATERALRSKLERGAETAWSEHSAERSWTAAGDAAEALYLLDPSDPGRVSRVIEARARQNRLLAAEAAYAEYTQTHQQGDEEPGLASLIDRVRELRTTTDEPRLPRPFVGRADALRRIDEVVAVAESGHTQCAVVLGEPGIGKSRFLEEVQRSASIDGFQCLSARAARLERQVSLSPLIDALDTIDLGPRLDDIGEPWRTVVGSLLPPGVHARSIDELPDIDSESLTRRLMDAFALLLKSLGDHRPTVLILDDAQWCDTTTIAVIQFFIRRYPDARVAILLSARPEGAKPDEPAYDLVHGAHRADLVLELTELTHEEGNALVQALGEDRISADEAERLFPLSGLHPLYLTELVRDLLAERLTLPQGPEVDNTIPMSIRQILEARMHGTSSIAQRVLEGLSVCGGASSIRQLGVVVGEPVDQIADAVEELRRVRMIDVDRYHCTIVHDLFRAAVYSELSPPMRALLHQRVAESLADDDVPGELATHLELAGDDEEAARWGWLAGERALAQGAVAEAAHHFGVASRCEGDPVARARATAHQAEALYLMRDLSRAVPALELAYSLLRECGEDFKARRIGTKWAEVVASSDPHRRDEVLSRLAALRAEARDARDHESDALCLDAELQLGHRVGVADRMTATIRKLKDARAYTDAASATVVHMGLAMSVVFGDPEVGLRAAREAVRLSEHAPQHRATALLRLMVALELRGLIMTPEGESVVGLARKEAAIRGDSRIAFMVESNLAVAYLDAGDLDVAEQQLVATSRLLSPTDLDLDGFNLANNFAELWLARGEFDTAGHWFRVAEERTSENSPPYMTTIVNSGLGLCALEVGNLSEMRKREAAVGPLPERWEFDPGTIIAFQVRLMERRREIEEARRLIEKASRDLAGRLDFAWLKLGFFRVKRLRKWGYHAEAQALSAEYQQFAAERALKTRAEQFATLCSGEF